MSFEKEVVYKFSAKGTNCRVWVEVRALGTTITIQSFGTKKALYFNHSSGFQQSTMVAIVEGALKTSESLQEFLFKLIIKRDLPNFYSYSLDN